MSISEERLAEIRRELALVAAGEDLLVEWDRLLAEVDRLKVEIIDWKLAKADSDAEVDRLTAVNQRQERELTAARIDLANVLDERHVTSTASAATSTCRLPDLPCNTLIVQRLAIETCYLNGVQLK
jgi:hypothetical protein